MERAVVDKTLADRVTQYKWFKNASGEPCTLINGKYVKMTKIICTRGGDGDIVEYINGNKLDCRDCNLRPVTPDTVDKTKRENRGVRKVHTRSGDQYMVYTCVGDKYEHNGTYKELDLAINAHDAILRSTVGENAPFLKITDWSRIETIPLMMKHEVDATRKKTGGEKKRAPDRIDANVWMQCTGYAPGGEPEGEAVFGDDITISNDEMRAMQQSSAGTVEYWKEMADWWYEVGSKWDIATGCENL